MKMQKVGYLFPLFIPLDIFGKSQQNKDISSKRDAWLTLFSNDDPDTIITLITAYPEFHNIYEEAYRICLNTERVMDMFSEELAILDRNTVKYMMDEMQNEMDSMRNVIDGLQDAVRQQADELERKQATIQEMREKNIEFLQNTISILRGLDLPESEIISRICDKYHLPEDQIQQYL